MKTILAFLVIFFSSYLPGLVYSQQANALLNLNLNFEKSIPGQKFPLNWFEWGTMDYSFKVDSVVRREGKYSMSIQAPKDKKESSFGCAASSIPVNFKGKSVKLSGKMKLENVKNGSAGLILRIDDKNNKSIQFDNMMQKNISGTIDWLEYSVTLPLDEAAKRIYFGGILSGTGKIWIDDFTLEIDNEDISMVQTVPEKIYKADSDKEFDNGSSIVITELNENSINNLYVLGKVWGFLKYYHPKIAEGEYNWDYELFRIIPGIINSSPEERNLKLLALVNSLGPITEFSTKKIEDVQNVVIYPELDWLKDKNIFSDELITKFEDIKNAKRPDDSYYIGLYPEILNPNFKNENHYAETVMDDGYRLLALYRYWNMIQYFFPYKNLIEEDWNGVLKEFIPKFINEKSNLDYHLNALKLIGRIHDTHANIWGSNKVLADYKGLRIAGPSVTFIEERAIVTSSFPFTDTSIKNNDDLKNGDEIISVNGKSVKDIITERLPLNPASNYPTQLRDIAFSLLRTNAESVSVEIERGGKIETAVLKTYPMSSLDYKKYYTANNKKSWSLINKNVGYLYPGTIQNSSLPEMMKAFKDTKGIVIDFRCYPSDFLVFDLGRYLMPQPTEFVKFRIGSVDFPGLFNVMDYTKTGEENKDYYKGKIIIIVDETTQSSAEYNTMALRKAPNGKVIGSTTAGADGNVSTIYLPGEIFTYISGIGVLTPEGKETQRIGIVPDVEIKPTVKGFREGKDELLLKAIEMIEN